MAVGSLALVVLVAAASRAQDGASSPAAGGPRSEVVDAARLLGDLEALSADEMQGRRTGTEGGAKARAYIVEAFRRRGVQAFGGGYLEPFAFEHRGQTYQANNVVGFVAGKSKGGRCLVVSAHYDHLGVVNGETYNGADDNASGVAALLALAEYFAQRRPAHTIVFAAFDAEELGLRGSQQFVAAPPVALSEIAADVNLDMVSHNDRNELYAAGAHASPFLKPYLDRVAARASVRLIEGHDDPKLGHDDWTMQSDQGAFYKAGVPFVYFGVEDHKDYHKPSDKFASINQAFFVRATETVLSTVRLLDKNLDKLPPRAATEKAGAEKQ
ncbi:MAG: M20/M25/M40 family metallo-hydrolase [Acidobacteria bacterium]|nr:M20/M25/M40 family metallo-hydrolase [Acidobacteriota bacterium]